MRFEKIGNIKTVLKVIITEASNMFLLIFLMMNTIMQGICMYFILDREIYFRPADGAIWSVDSESDKKYLTLASSRLLEFLIEHQGEIVSRDVIFQSVWERYGLHSSNNTLNQYISLLRRTLADFGLGAHVIKTIPKTGFLFSADFTISTVLEKHNAIDPTDPPSIRLRNKSLAYFLGFLFAICILVALFPK